MKRILAILLAVLTLFCLTACANTDETPEGMKDVTVAGTNYKLYVPETWIALTGINGSGARANTASTGENGYFSPNVIVTMELLDVDMTPADYFANVVSPELSLVYDDLTMLEEGKELTLGGKDARGYTYSYTFASKFYKQMQVVTVFGLNAYVLTYTASEAEFGSYLTEVEKIISEFTFR